MQDAAAQTPDAQTPLVQSLPVAHTCPSAQSFGQLPPQSTSVSSPLRALSVQLGAWQLPPLQTALEQSLEAVQDRPTAQGPQLPPQSTSVSSPFCTASVQTGEESSPPPQAVAVARTHKNARKCNRRTAGV